MIKGRKPKKNNYIYKSIFLVIFILFLNYPIKYQAHNKSIEDITLVTSLYQLPTNRHNFSLYFKWIENLLKINKPIIFFIQKNLSKIIRSKRPKLYENKTIWIEIEFSNLYFYKYKKEFEKTYKIDKLQNVHSVQLFILWNEKLKFLERAISIFIKFNNLI